MKSATAKIMTETILPIVASKELTIVFIPGTAVMVFNGRRIRTVLSPEKFPTPGINDDKSNNDNNEI